MAQKLEVIKGGGGSIRVGATGTISSLMNRELNSMRHTQPMPTSSSKRKPPMISVSVPCAVITPKRLQPRISSDETSCSSSRSINHRYYESTRKTRHRGLSKNSAHLVPMLGSNENCGDNTPNREKFDKRVSNIAEVVDLKCVNRSKWSNPITNRLRKLGFSKLSQTLG